MSEDKMLKCECDDRTECSFCTEQEAQDVQHEPDTDIVGLNMSPSELISLHELLSCVTDSCCRVDQELNSLYGKTRELIVSAITMADSAHTVMRQAARIARALRSRAKKPTHEEVEHALGTHQERIDELMRENDEKITTAKHWRKAPPMPRTTRRRLRTN